MIVIKDEKGKDAYGIDSTGTCLRVSRWQPRQKITKGAHKGKMCEAKWVPLECYPHNLEHAGKLIFKMAVLDEVNVKSDLKELCKALDKWNKEINTKLDIDEGEDLY